jgi:hypothetical protein
MILLFFDSYSIWFAGGAGGAGGAGEAFSSFF